MKKAKTKWTVSPGFEIAWIYYINLSSELSGMGIFEKVDYVTKRCDDLMAGLIGITINECTDHLQCMSHKFCVDFNTNHWEEELYFDAAIDINEFFIRYLSIFFFIFGIIFAFLNILLFLKHKGLRNPFTMLIVFQSIYCILWFLNIFSVYLVFREMFGLISRTDSNYKKMSDNTQDFLTINLEPFLYHLSYLFSFGIETIRFFKAIQRLLF